MRAVRLAAWAAVCAVAIGATASVSAAALTLTADQYEIDSGHSSVIFRVNHIGASYCYGRFNDISGTLSTSRDGEISAILVEIKTESLDTNHAERDAHLKGEDFFNVAKHPTIKFVGKKFEKAGDKKYKITGDMTLLGVTKSITADVEYVGTVDHPRAGIRSGVDGTFTFKRSDFGMSAMVPSLGDEVRIYVGLEGVKK
jgi:polyisoprenoid-binding protein YceI